MRQRGVKDNRATPTDNALSLTTSPNPAPHTTKKHSTALLKQEHVYCLDLFTKVRLRVGHFGDSAVVIACELHLARFLLGI